MTFEQNTEAEDMSKWTMRLNRVNFWYSWDVLFRREKPTVVRKESWNPGLKNRKGRSCFGIKIGGPNPNFAYMRDTTDFSPASIKYALDNSLQRLQTDYIDFIIGQNVKQIFSKRV
jgi:hypothetical protein